MQFRWKLLRIMFQTPISQRNEGLKFTDPNSFIFLYQISLKEFFQIDKGSNFEQKNSSIDGVDVSLILYEYFF